MAKIYEINTKKYPDNIRVSFYDKSKELGVVDIYNVKDKTQKEIYNEAINDISKFNAKKKVQFSRGVKSRLKDDIRFYKNQ